MDNGKCVFTGSYRHLNDLLEFDPNMKFKFVRSPKKCIKSNNTLVLIGIKSMPKNQGRRNAIRKTWLNPVYWNQLGYDIHIVFLVGEKLSNTSLINEFEETGDILQLDFEESHYRLPFKDKAYFEYIQYNCPQADYVLKLDDDILLIPG